MKSFMDAEKQPVIPHFIEGVLDFKGFITNFIASWEQKLIGDSQGQQFKFYLHQNLVLILKEFFNHHLSEGKLYLLKHV